MFEEQRLTYREFNARTNRLAHYLMRQGVGADVCVGVCMDPSLEMVVSLYAILKAGGAFVPLDPEYPQERLGFMLEDAQVSVLLTQRHLLPVLPDHSSQVICVDTDGSTFNNESDENPVVDYAKTEASINNAQLQGDV